MENYFVHTFFEISFIFYTILFDCQVAVSFYKEYWFWTDEFDF